ncbi:MAG: HIT domain-containing protein [Dehalococcoidia bacterium]|nr:HIT domain-containing protein [Dehalococcoidia bacterium]
MIAGESTGEIVYQDEEVVAFLDKYPKAPTHILIVPREHIPSLAQVDEERSGLVARMVLLANRLAKEREIAEQGYRLVINSGYWGGQAIPHLHMHLLGGRPLRW